MSKRVLFHVGTPKTGTSYLQDVLFRNTELLRGRGILYPAQRFDAHFLAALDLMRLPWGGLEDEAVGAWDALAEQVRDFDGTSIISHEIFATASPAQIRRAMESLGDAEVHVVISVRDLVRQIPAEWQENVKHRRTINYKRFLRQIQDPERAGGIASWFWGVQEIPNILERWGADLPPERVHLVTVPKPGARRNLLWDRFARTFELDGIDLDLNTGRSNPSLGVPETALMRRINIAVNGVLEPAEYRPLVRELLAHVTLSQRKGSPRLALPPDSYAWAAEVSRDWVEQVRERGYTVVGDLADLLADEERPPYSDPDRPRERQVSDAGVDAIRALLLHNVRERQHHEHLLRELEVTREQRDWHAAKTLKRHTAEEVVGRLNQSPSGRAALAVYRRARGRNSRSA